MIDLLELFPDFDFEDEPAHDASFGQSMKWVGFGSLRICFDFQ